MNTTGHILRFTDFGESHGPAIGGVLDGFPAGVKVDFAAIDAMLARRRTGQHLTSARKEPDEVEWLSGIYEGHTLGTPIAFIIRNHDARSTDYTAIAKVYRPNHADYTYAAKYGHTDPRGGGRASARETAARVVAGALAMQHPAMRDISIEACTVSVGPANTPASIEEAIEEARRSGDTLGCIVECMVKGVPVGLGEPIFGKVQARLAEAMLGINAAKGFEYGDGFALARAKGSEVIDEPYVDNDGKVAFRTNHSGGALGGITNGCDIVFRVAFKPIATLMQPVNTITRDGNAAILSATGRHDVCVAPRVLPVVEAMTALVLADLCMEGTAHSALRD